MAVDAVEDTVERFFCARQSAPPGVLIAHSGGPDSTALLVALARLLRAGRLAISGLHAAHLDHDHDAASVARSDFAARTCVAWGVPHTSARCSVARERRPSESFEAAARRLRYAFLERVRRDVGADVIALGHHADDQAETVALRLLRGTGLAGLAAMRPRHERLVRPLLHLPKSDLLSYLSDLGVPWIHDATNLDLAVLRNRIRHRLLPWLEAEVPDLSERLGRLAERTAGAAAVVADQIETLFPGLSAERALDLEAYQRLPEGLRPFALAALHRAAGVGLPPSRAARAALEKRLIQWGADGACTIDCGAGIRWLVGGGRLRVAGAEARAPARSGPLPSEVQGFTYTFSVPGRVAIPEIGMAMTLRAGEFSDWMLDGHARRAGLALPLAPGDRATVRSRQPGDRVRPLGAPGTRKLKELLIDRRVERAQRDHLPLLCVDRRIAWIPGVAIDDAYRITASDSPIWIAELEPLRHESAPPSTTHPPRPVAESSGQSHRSPGRNAGPTTLASEVAES